MKNCRHILFAMLVCLTFSLHANPPKQEYYTLRIYEVKTNAQEQLVDEYLSKALIPALHRMGIRSIGVFKPIEQDTSARKIYMLVPLRTLMDLEELETRITSDAQYKTAGQEYLNAPYDNPPYVRRQTIVLKAFSHHPEMKTPRFRSERSERVYELRSYEGHTERIFKNKVKMFNEGGEIALFNRLGFNAVFYAEVISGPRMPNLMYMTTFENRKSRDEHWQTFGDDPEWKSLSSMPEYQHNVSKADIWLLRPTEYSDY